jgi:quercetin dioxygenase-like cupin family protein
MVINKNKKLKTKFHSDSRGEIYINKIKGLEFNYIFTKAGAYRAGDYHSAKQYSIIISGKIEITLRQKNRDIIKKYGPNELIIIPTNTPHLYKFLTDTVMIEWLSGPYKPRYYQPYRKKVNLDSGS